MTWTNFVALVAVVPKAALTINGPTKSWAGKGSSGKDVHRIFCGECGSPIAHDPDAAPEIIAIKAGTLSSEIKKTLKPVRGAKWSALDGGANFSLSTGHRDLDCWQASLLPGAPGEAFQAHA